MAEVVPTILATTAEDYGLRIDRVKSFAKRIHIDISDGDFSDTRTVGLPQVHLPEGLTFDLHLMLSHPEDQLETIISLHPNLVIVHYESQGDLKKLLEELKAVDIRVGLAILPETSVKEAGELLLLVDHLLVFTGTLGHNHGEFQRSCLAKIKEAREINSELEIGVDGGIDLATGKEAVDAGADVLDCGSFIHDATDPEVAYKSLEAVAGVTV